MSVFNFKPARQAPTEIITDLDKIIAEPVAFRFQGNIHEIKPLNTKEFFKITQALAKMDLVIKKDEVSFDEMVDAYTDIIESCCDTIKRKDILQMTQAQVGALFQLILDTVTGRVHAEKKNLKT